MDIANGGGLQALTPCSPHRRHRAALAVRRRPRRWDKRVTQPAIRVLPGQRLALRNAHQRGQHALDGALSPPAMRQGELPVGLMVSARRRRDDAVLNVGQRIEELLQNNSCWRLPTKR